MEELLYVLSFYRWYMNFDGFLFFAFHFFILLISRTSRRPTRPMNIFLGDKIKLKTILCLLANANVMFLVLNISKIDILAGNLMSSQLRITGKCHRDFGRHREEHIWDIPYTKKMQYFINETKISKSECEL